MTPKLRTLLRAMAEGETLWQLRGTIGPYGPFSLGGDPVHASTVAGAIRHDFIAPRSSPKGVQFYQLTDRGRAALARARA